MKFLKPVAELLAGPLTHVINRCIRNNYIPIDWKVARISPIPKIDQPMAKHDYRPVSILLALSKIFERLVAHQTTGFIEERALFGENVSGFRKNH